MHPSQLEGSDSGARKWYLPFNVLFYLVAGKVLLSQEAIGYEPVAWLAVSTRVTIQHPILLLQAYQPAVAIASPISKKSITTADTIVKTECQALLPNLHGSSQPVRYIMGEGRCTCIYNRLLTLRSMLWLPSSLRSSKRPRMRDRLSPIDSWSVCGKMCDGTCMSLPPQEEDLLHSQPHIAAAGHMLVQGRVDEH